MVPSLYPKDTGLRSSDALARRTRKLTLLPLSSGSLVVPFRRRPVSLKTFSGCIRPKSESSHFFIFLRKFSGFQALWICLFHLFLACCLMENYLPTTLSTACALPKNNTRKRYKNQVSFHKATRIK